MRKVASSRKKILILPMYGIGDVLMTTPALRNLSEQLDAEITYLHMFETTRDILTNNPCLDENIYFPFLKKEKWDSLRFLLEFRKKFDFSINFYPSNRLDYNLAALIAGSPIRIGHRYFKRNLLELNFLKNRTIKEDDLLHNVEENLKLLDFLSLKNPKPYPLKLYLTEEEKVFALQWIKEKQLDKKILIGIHPGASIFKNHDKKRWTSSSFAKLIDRLTSEIDHVAFLIFGGLEEKPLRNEVISLVHSKKNVCPIEGLSVRQAASVIGNCHIFVSNDSGPMHIAVALGIPTVAIFGPTNPIWVRPWAVEHRIVRLNLRCSPCFRYSPMALQCVSNLAYACIKDITPDMVFDACLDLLGKTK